ncbi:MAG: signal recognition particle protein [Victivallales bacterium]|nr:signal recognition particle protein [Victivallales bacterium]
MFESLTEKLHSAFRKLTGNAQISESNMSEAMGEVRNALLDADVNYDIANQFIEEVKQECLGQDVLKSVTPGQQAVKIVYDRLIVLMGETATELTIDGATPETPAVIMLCGLNGNGKTTTAAKLANFLQKKNKKRTLLAACDLTRPAAIDQLEVLGQSLALPVYADRASKDVVAVAQAAVAQAKAKGCPVVLLDTAGRLQIDEPLVQELVRVKDAVHPQEILLVADAALGQEAVSVAKHFNDALDVTGIILTKLDGDARGGAALSMRQAIGKPVKFVTTGEQTIDLETFHPDRMASRILGMGDILTLVERAQTEFKEEEARKLEEKVRNATFDFEDFLTQLNRIQKMGGMMSLLKFLPGMGNLPAEALDEKTFKHTEGIIRSMTPSERQLPETINASRRARIAKGSGSTPQEVTEQIKVFMNMRDVMSQVSRGGGASMMNTLFGGGTGLANLASMMQSRMDQTGNQGFASRGISHAQASARANEKARKEAKRKAEKAARKKNRRH